jgi:hypothetical protein
MDYHSDSGDEADSLVGESGKGKERSHIGAELRCVSCNRRRTQRKREKVIGLANLVLFLISLTFVLVSMHRWNVHKGERNKIVYETEMGHYDHKADVLPGISRRG